MKIRLTSYKPRQNIITGIIKKTVVITITKNYIPRCQDCQHAAEYIPHWIYPHGDPRCSLHHRSISPGEVACKDFCLMGRLSR